jgi:hypothetical protein
VAAFAVLPFLVGLFEHGADGAFHGGLVGEDLDDVDAALDLAVETLDGVGVPPACGGVDQILAQCGFGNRANAVRSSSASSSMRAISGNEPASESVTLR